MELHDVSYGIEYVARPLLLFFSSENRLLWFRYREYDLAHLKLIFEFSIYNVWKSVQYGVSNGLDTAYWGFLGVGTTFDIFQNIILIPYLEYGVLSPLDTARVPFDERNNPPQHPRIVYPPILDINYFRHFLDIHQNLNPMDDEPMWAADRVVALATSSAITIPETANEFAIKATKNLQASIQNLEAKFDRFADKQSGRPSGSLLSNTQPNLKGSSSKPYQSPQVWSEHVNAVFTRSGKSYDPPDNPNDQQNNSETSINFDSIDEDEEPTPQPKPKILKPVKETPIPKPYKPKFHILNASEKKGSSIWKIPQHDPSRSNQPDLGASINLMPYSLYTKLSLETLKPTKMSIRLADQSFQYPVGIVENMLVEVGKFTFPDFVILEMEEDSKVPLIIGRPFLHTADVVIRVKQKQLNLRVGTE
ncbi:reverse transcriptase domain-containing protein [Tanacetum coccineum]